MTHTMTSAAARAADREEARYRRAAAYVTTRGNNETFDGSVATSDRQRVDAICTAQIALQDAVFGSRAHEAPRVVTCRGSTEPNRGDQELFSGSHLFGAPRGCILAAAALLGGIPFASQMPSLPPGFADRLRWLMATRRNPADGRRYSNASLGRAIGMNEKTVGNWLRDDNDPERTEPGATNLRSLCAEFDVAADFLLGRSEHECGLTSGTYLVDLDAYEHLQPGAEWAAEIPPRPVIVAAERIGEMRAARKNRGRA